MPTFDPYHQWLGIPAAEQPPNHYRLLGVPLLESDLDVIEVAGRLVGSMVVKSRVGVRVVP